jgi:hypothetical protein
MTVCGTPCFKASGSWATHSNWLSISRAVARIAISRVRAVKPASKRRYWLIAATCDAILGL